MKTLLNIFAGSIIIFCIAILIFSVSHRNEDKEDNGFENMDNFDSLSAERQGEGYFFPENTASCVYGVKSSELSIEETNLIITKIRDFEEGSLYELKCDYYEDFKDAYGIPRLYLGFFFVQEDRIYFIRDENVKEELTRVDLITDLGTLVCQEEERADALDVEEPGWHESITADGNRREYRGYNTLTETGYYESFIWEAGKGLVEYRSGYGAGADAVELLLESLNVAHSNTDWCNIAGKASDMHVEVSLNVSHSNTD